MLTVSSIARIPSTAAWSAASLSPRPIHRAAPIAAASVTRTSSSARFLSGGSGGIPVLEGDPALFERAEGGAEQEDGGKTETDPGAVCESKRDRRGVAPTSLDERSECQQSARQAE